MNHVNFTHKLVLRFSQFICIVILLMGDGIISLTPRQHVSANSSAVIDFKTLLNVPIELQQPIRSAVNSVALESLPDSNLAVSAVNQSQNWLYAILVANHAIDKHWEEASDKDFVEVLAHRQADGGWISFVKGTQGFLELAQAVPPVWIDFSYLTKDTLAQPSTVTLTQSVEYLFPWTIGQKWFQVQGWHQGDHLDFQPVVRTNPPTHFAVLAAAGGTMSLVCGGRGTLDPYQAHIRISHPDGNSTYYLHLDANTIRYDLIGKSIVRGQFIGLLYNGVQGSGNGYQYNTNCGYGQAVHLHFGAPRTITINGYDINTVASAAFATQYGSSNTRIDGVPENTVIDNPLDGATIQDDVFTIRGWAIYPPAASGTGVTNVHVWLDAPSPPNGQFLGGATYGIDRPDVASLYGETYRYSGFEFTWDTHALSPGLHTLYIAARHPDASWSANQIRTVTIQHPTRIVVESPTENGTIQQGTTTIQGWAIYQTANLDTGVTDVHVWLDTPAPNGQFLGGARYGIDRPDVASLYGETYRYSGFELTWDARAVAPGTHTLYIAARHPDASWSADLIRTVTIQAPTTITPSPTPSTTVTLSPTTMTPSPTPSTTVTPSPTSSTTVTPSSTSITPSPTSSTTVTPSPTSMTPSPTPITSHYSVYLPMIQR